MLSAPLAVTSATVTKVLGEIGECALHGLGQSGCAVLVVARALLRPVRVLGPVPCSCDRRTSARGPVEYAYSTRCAASSCASSHLIASIGMDLTIELRYSPGRHI